MAKHRLQKPALPVPLTRTEQRAAAVDKVVKQELADRRTAQRKKLDRLRALREAREKDSPADGEPENS